MSGFFRMSSTRLDFFFFFLTFKITDCGACRLPCELLFFRRYGQKVGLAAVSIGYRAILKQNLRTLQTAFYVGLLAKRQACLHFALCKKKRKKVLHLCLGEGKGGCCTAWCEGVPAYLLSDEQHLLRKWNLVNLDRSYLWRN